MNFLNIFIIQSSSLSSCIYNQKLTWDDGFEQFLAEDWRGKEKDEHDISAWGDVNIEDDFNKQFKAQLETKEPKLLTSSREHVSI